jgi:predicted MPP superfamily phosphohydrolase
MLSRRRFLQWLLSLGIVGAATSAYAVVVEPLLRLRITRYDLKLRRWPDDLPLTIAVISDLHACKPWMDLDRVHSVVDETNNLRPDVIALLGDYAPGPRLVREAIDTADWTKALSGLKAPLGVHAILGNHDWWSDPAALEARRGPTIAQRGLEAVGIPVYQNDAVRLTKAGRSFWLAGLGDQLAFEPVRRRNPGIKGLRVGVDDLGATLGKVPEGDPVILLAHEPDIVPRVPERVALVLSGHTHGGQVRVFGWSPIVPSRYGNRYAYGHVREQCDLIVSGGLGCSIMPVRFGVPPEIVLVSVNGARGASRQER